MAPNDRRSGGYVPGSEKRPETFRNMTMAWNAMNQAPSQTEPKPMNMPIPETYPMAKQGYFSSNQRISKDTEKTQLTPQHMALYNKNGYSNSKSNSNSNSKSNSNSNSYYNSYSNSDAGSIMQPKQKPGDKVNGELDSESLSNPFREQESFCYKPKELSLEDVIEELKNRLGITAGDMIWLEMGQFYQKLGWNMCLHVIEKAQILGYRRWSYIRSSLKELERLGVRT